MRSFSSHDARQRFGDLLAMVKSEPVAIMKYRRRAAVLISSRDFEEFRRLREDAAHKDVSCLLNKIDSADERQADVLLRKLRPMLRNAEAMPR